MTAAAVTPAVAPRIFVAYFDDAHLTPAGFKRVQAAARTLFSKEFKDGDMGGVVHNGLMANSRLTSNRAEILKAVGDAKPNSDKNSRLFDQRQWPRLSEVEAVWISEHNDRTVLAQATQCLHGRAAAVSECGPHGPWQSGAVDRRSAGQHGTRP